MLNLIRFSSDGLRSRSQPPAWKHSTVRLFDYDRASALMRAAEVDLILASSRPNVGYFADYWHSVSDEFYVLWDTDVVHYTLCGIPRDEALGPFLVPGADETTAVEDSDPWIKERYFWGPGYYMTRWQEDDPDPGHPMDVAAEVLRSKGLERGTVAVEMRYLGASYLNRLRALLPDLRLVDAEPILWKLRKIKTPEEQRRLQEACGRTVRAWATVAAGLHEGLTEVEIQRQFVHAFAEEDMVYERAYIIVGPSGKQLNNGTPLPGDTALTQEMLVRCDIQGRYEGYLCNMSRLAGVGTTNGGLRDVVAQVTDLVESLSKLLRPGTKVTEVRILELDTYRKLGVTPLIPYTGHGVGRVVHEPPYLSLKDDTVLEPGMVVTLEPGIVYTRGGEINICIEDQYLITEEGATCLTANAKRLIDA